MARKSRKPSKQKLEFEIQEQALANIPTAIYLRKSDDDMESIEVQGHLVQRYLDKLDELVVFDTFIDNNYSGSNFNRPEFQRLLKLIESKLIKCVVVKDLSRLGRDSVEIGYYMEHYFPQHQVRFIAINDNYDSDNPACFTKATEYISRNIANELYVQDISTKVKSTFRSKQKNGEFLGTFAPYGYNLCKKNRFQLEIDAETAPTVKKIFEWYIGGFGFTKIARYLNDADIPCPMLYHQRQGHIKKVRKNSKLLWQKNSVSKILSNPVYTGDMVQAKSRTVSFQRIYNSKEEWVTKEKTHPAIVTKEIFEKAQKIRNERFMESQKYYGDETDRQENILAGKVFCGNCGRPLGRHKYRLFGGATIYRYSCTTKSISSFACKPTQISSDTLLDTILTAIKSQINHFADIEKVISDLQYNSTYSLKIKALQQAVRETRRAITRNNCYRNAMYKDLASKKITEAEYQSKKTALNKEERELKMRLDSKIKKLSEYQKLSDLSEQVEKFKGINGIESLSKNTIDAFINKVKIYDPYHIEIDFAFEDKIKEIINSIEVMQDECTS